MKHPDMVQEIQRITGINPRKCMRCGKCSAACPAYGEMEYHPHQFVAMIERGALEELMASRAIWNCLSCMACLERCPRPEEWVRRRSTPWLWPRPWDCRPPGLPPGPAGRPSAWRYPGRSAPPWDLESPDQKFPGILPLTGQFPGPSPFLRRRNLSPGRPAWPPGPLSSTGPRAQR